MLQQKTMEDKPNFSSYDYETLLDVYGHIDERQYPERKTEVAKLLEQRKNSPETLQQQNKRRAEKRYDTFFQRLFAHIIDSLILWVPSLLIAATVLASPGFVAIAVAIVGELLIVAYYILLHWRYGQTIGKKIMSVRVVNNVGEGQISLRQSVIREILPFVVIGVAAIASVFIPSMHSVEGLLSGEPSRFQSLAGTALLIWAALEIITILFHQRHRALHDLISNTVVVNELPPET